MANLVGTETFEFPVDRQDLYNHWATAVLSSIERSELASGVFTLDIGTTLSDATSSPEPGHHFWSRLEGLMFVFHDEVDGTGVSLWLAIGPDRFDVAAILSEPTGGGAVVRPVYDRWVQIFSGSSGAAWNTDPIGTHAGAISLSGFSGGSDTDAGTAASGTWAPISIDGIVWGNHQRQIETDKWVKVLPWSTGSANRSHSASDQPGTDDNFGYGLTTFAGASAVSRGTPFVWLGPRSFLNNDQPLT